MSDEPIKIRPFKTREEFDAYKATHELDKDTFYIYDWVSEEEYQRYIRCLNGIDKELTKLREENEILRHTIHEWQHDCNKKREKLEALKPILEFYSTSFIGDLLPDGTYGYAESTASNNLCGSNNCSNYSEKYGCSLPRNTRVIYDPRPAKEGLRIIEDN